jgi:hypothetical protein
VISGQVQQNEKVEILQIGHNSYTFNGNENQVLIRFSEQIVNV